MFFGAELLGDEALPGRWAIRNAGRQEKS